MKHSISELIFLAVIAILGAGVTCTMGWIPLTYALAIVAAIFLVCALAKYLNGDPE